ncbi:MAG: hypothetical protein JST93_08830 [Acidobacteria bacterium]|nr:hypothetical protein [Acidobacteriota bacterium]
MGWKVEFSGAALEALADMDKTERRFVLGSIKTHLCNNDPTEVTRNKFPLRRPSVHAERELRLQDWRVFYAVRENPQTAVVQLIGQKRGNKLIINGEEFEL